MLIPCVVGSSNIPPAYVGPGDVLGNARAFWGLRAYKNSSIGSNCVNIKRASDTTTQDFITLGNGLVDVPSITTFLASTTGVVQKLYDQTGNGWDLTTTALTLPNFILSDATTGRPCIRFVRATPTNIKGTTNDTLSQPFTIAGIMLSNLSASANGVYFSVESSIVNVGAADSGVNGMYTYTGTTLENAAPVSGTLHDFAGVANGASSHMYVDGADSAGNAGANTISGSPYKLGSFHETGTNAFNGDGKECGVWASALGANAVTAYHLNSKAFWGY